MLMRSWIVQRRKALSMKMSMQRSDIRVSLWSGRYYWRVGLCGGIAGGVNGGPLDFRCENTVLVLYSLILPPATAPLLYYSAVKIEISSHNLLCIVFVTTRSPYLMPIVR